MKRLTLLIVISIYLLSCGGGKETISETSLEKDRIARSLVQQKGERPAIAPETLNPKVPPQKIISSTKAAPSIAAPKVVKAAEPKPVVTKEIVKKDTVTVASPKKVVQAPKDTVVAVVKKTIQVADKVAAPVADIVERPAEPVQTVPAGNLNFQNLSFDDIYFDDKSTMPSSTFNSNYYVTLGKIVKALRSDPEIKVRITGYTDFEGSEQYNYELSEKRAKTFGKILLELFPVEIQSAIAQRIEINPKSSSELLVESSNKARRTLNRRVSFELFYGELQNNPYAVYMHAMPSVSMKPSSPSVPALARSSSAPASMQKKLYDKAMMLFNQQRYNESIEIFDEIVAIDPKHSLTDNAYFWIGEALYYQNRYAEALQAYQKVFGAGDGNKEAAAQMRLGYCYFRLNQLDQATIEFRKVINNYPDAPEEIRRSELVLSKIKNY
ncbi:MAG: tetratricopeptide repeat protein [Candidatus Marinimicrobia bacterium]|nr:tetratricopeptide repeat protein [Candidatus Neomarinimicrobiota bacterium]